MVIEKGMFWAAAPICISSSMDSNILFNRTNVKKSRYLLSAGTLGASQNFVILIALIHN